MLKDSFCPSPWFHLRLQHNGDYKECRWFKISHTNNRTLGIANTSIMQFYNSDYMKSMRNDLLNGQRPAGCANCYYSDNFDKLSGRRRQFLKSGINEKHFELSVISSPHYTEFLHSLENQGHSRMAPVDLQIDLGNTCNGACIMCNHMSSSRLAADFVKLHKIKPEIFYEPPNRESWIHNPDLVKKFAEDLTSIPGVKYIHFLGGETLFIDAFYTLCEQLIAAGLAKNVIVGTTTNGSIYDERIEKIISEFKEFHLGLSIESVTALNDYVRYPANTTQVLENFDKFFKLRETTGLHVSLRITPNIFTIYELDRMFGYMIENNVIAESCDILADPDCLLVELIPDDIRQEILDKIDTVIDKYSMNKTYVTNPRRNDLVHRAIADVIVDYRNFIANFSRPDNVEQLRYKLVDFLKSFESLRGNSIIDHAPRYKDFLRSYGY